MYNSWETLTSFLVLFFFAFPEITCRNRTSNSTHPFSCSVFPFLISFLSFWLVLHREFAAVGGHQEAAPHTLHSSSLMPAFVNSSRGGFFPLLWWPGIKQKFRTDPTLKLHFPNSPRSAGEWGGKVTVCNKGDTPSNSSVLSCSPKSPSLKRVLEWLNGSFK